MLNKSIPYNLKELAIQKVKLRPAEASALMKILTFANLKRLSLVQLNINSEGSFAMFLEYLKMCQLEDLDLRDSKVSHDQFMQVLDVLKHNKQLRSLNIAHNNLIKPTKARLDKRLAKRNNFAEV